MALAVPKLSAALLYLLQTFQHSFGRERRLASDACCNARRMTMLLDEVRPTTLEGVKRLAAQISKKLGLKYSDALEQAARAASCENFRHAKRTLPERLADQPRSHILMTVYWQDTRSGFKIGRETLRVELSKPLLSICDKVALKTVRGFGGLRMVAADHLVSDLVVDSQEAARSKLLGAERSLRFMEYTGLRPWLDNKAKPKFLDDDQLPNRDHSTNWVHPATGAFVLIDEPYRPAPDDEARSNWAQRHGWRVVKTTWPGMYYPYSCDLFVVADTGTALDIDSLVGAINGMPEPDAADQWSGESASDWETFVSPLAATPQDIRRARARGTIYPTSSAATVPYSYSVNSDRRRPAAKMGIPGHVAAGHILKAVLGARNRPFSVYTRLNRVRSTLEDWMTMEIARNELDGPEYFEVYYTDTEADQPFQKAAETHAGIVDMLMELDGQLRKAYPNCAPLRELLHRIDMSIRLVSKAAPSH